jgi:ABC-type multidrug transport system ATPase subunit
MSADILLGQPIILISLLANYRKPTPSTRNSHTRTREMVEISMKRRMSTLKTVPTTIACKEVRYAIKPKKTLLEVMKRSVLRKGASQDGEKIILSDVSALFNPGRFTAIMGASGAGKTSLLNFIGGYVSKEASMSGTIMLNGQVVDPRDLKKVTAFVFQDDVIMETMTVREAIEMSALLRLPKSITRAERKKKVDALLRELQLEKCQNTCIGNQWVKGISGGERKRTAIAMELVVNPAVLMLDEPTSGLDTFTAYNVIECLSELARSQQRTIAATLHQPSSEIFFLVDDLILMSAGRVVYHGPVKEVVEYFDALGFPCPLYTNPADHIFMAILNETPTIEEERKENADELQLARLNHIRSVWRQSPEYEQLVEKINAEVRATSAEECETIMRESAARSASINIQFAFLCRRVLKGIVRSSLTQAMRILQMIVVGFTVGFIFYDLGSKSMMTQSTNRLGALNFYAINIFLSSSLGVVTTFVNEKHVFQREYSTGYYSTLPYFMSKVLVELPIQLIMPLIAMLVSYFMIGFRSGSHYFFKAYLSLVCLNMVGVSVGTLAGAVFKDINRGMMVLGMLLLPFLVFSGMIVNNHTLPLALRWVPYVSPTWYAFTSLARNELMNYRFPRCKIPDERIQYLFKVIPGGAFFDCTGNSTLKFNDLHKGPRYFVCILVLLAMYVAMMFLSYFALWRSAKNRQ